MSGCTFVGNNDENTFHLLHPAVLVMGPQDSAFGLRIEDCTFPLDLASQRFGVVFSGGHTYDDVVITRNTFIADPNPVCSACCADGVTRGVAFESGSGASSAFYVFNNSGDCHPPETTPAPSPPPVLLLAAPAPAPAQSARWTPGALIGGGVVFTLHGVVLMAAALYS